MDAEDDIKAQANAPAGETTAAESAQKSGALDAVVHNGRPRCDVCGEPAYTHISNMVGGQLQMRHLCDACTDLHNAQLVPGQRRSEGSILILIGLFVITLSILADWCAFGSSAGFGWRQAAGVGLAALMFLLGAVIRVPGLIITGVLAGLLALLADWLGFGNTPGFGWQQRIGTVLGLAMLLAGLIVTRSTRKPRGVD